MVRPSSGRTIDRRSRPGAGVKTPEMIERFERALLAHLRRRRPDHVFTGVPPDDPVGTDPVADASAPASNPDTDEHGA